MSNIPFNYKKYVDDLTKMSQRGHVDSGEQIASPKSAGSRGLAKLTDFTNKPNELMKANMTESMRNIIDMINEEPTNEASERDILLNKISDLKMSVGDSPSVDDDLKTAIISSLETIEDDLGLAFDHEYQPMPDGDELTFEDDDEFHEAFGYLGYPEDETELFDAEYQGRKVPLNKPMRGDVKKFKVYVKDPKTGNVKKVNFGHGGSSAKRKTMRIRKSNPKARKSFRARHNCANPGPKTKARYWSCRKW